MLDLTLVYHYMSYRKDSEGDYAEIRIVTTVETKQKVLAHAYHNNQTIDIKNRILTEPVPFRVVNQNRVYLTPAYTEPDYIEFDLVEDRK